MRFRSSGIYRLRIFRAYLSTSVSRYGISGKIKICCLPVNYKIWGPQIEMYTTSPVYADIKIKVLGTLEEVEDYTLIE